MFDSHGFKSNRQKECVQMRGNWPDQTLDQAFGLLVAVSTSRLSCKRAGKTQTLMPVWDSSGESRFQRFCQQITADEVCGTQKGRYVSHCAVGQETALFCQNDAKLGKQKLAFFFRQLDATRAPCPLSSPTSIPGGLSKPNMGNRWGAPVFFGRGIPWSYRRGVC